MKRFALAALVAAIVFASCNITGTGIYESIANEEEILDFSLDNNTTPVGLAVFGSTVFVAAKGLHSKDFATTQDWAAITGAPALISRLVAFGGKGWIVGRSDAGTNPQLVSFSSNGTLDTPLDAATKLGADTQPLD